MCAMCHDSSKVVMEGSEVDTGGGVSLLRPADRPELLKAKTTTLLEMLIYHGTENYQGGTQVSLNQKKS